MSPLQRDVLRLLADNEGGLGLHDIANRISQKTGRRIPYTSVGGAFSHRRSWLESSTGKLNDRAVVTLSAEGRQALADYDAHREATHPMGPQVAGSFFVFVEEVHVITRHTMVVRNVKDAAEAEDIARQQCDEGMYPATMSVSIDRSYRVRPMRTGHGG